MAELLLRFRIESAPLAEGGGEAAPQVAPDELCEPAAWPAYAAFVSLTVTGRPRPPKTTEITARKTELGEHPPF